MIYVIIKHAKTFAHMHIPLHKPYAHAYPDIRQVKPGKFDIVLTSFEIACREKATFKKIEWKYFVIDEAHRIKNEDSLLSKVLFCVCILQSFCVCILQSRADKGQLEKRVSVRVREKQRPTHAHTHTQTHTHAIYDVGTYANRWFVNSRRRPASCSRARHCRIIFTRFSVCCACGGGWHVCARACARSCVACARTCMRTCSRLRTDCS